MKRLAHEHKQTPKKVCEVAAKGFVRDVVKWTPPASKGATGSDARKQGEVSVSVDLAKILTAASPGSHGPFESPADVHARFRNPRTGRVNRSLVKGGYRKGNKAQVDAATLAAYKKKIIAHVGLLASGWNAAAEKLGVKLPAWVRRHGTGHGSVQVKTDGFNISITVNNEVKFVGDVKDYDRRVEWAFKNQIRKMDREADFLMRKAIRAAGFP